MKAIPIGVSDYRELKENDYYCIDKTLIIKDFLERKSKVTLITRPRRFGKTINMSMLSEFFDITKDSKEIFKDTLIMKTSYASEINQYPTIFISFADAKRDKMTVVSTIKNQILKEWKKYKYVFKDLDEFDLPLYHSLLKVLTQEESTLVGINDAISFLMERLQDYYHKEVMVFIDEYDTPFVEAHIGGFYDEVKGGLSGLLHNSLKTSNSLKYAMLTGIQRVAKENIFSDLNNLVVYTVLDKAYSEYFGFNSKEVKDLLNYYHLELNEEVKEMYDGYKIGDTDIYNPWSILNYANTGQLVPYWVNTSANTMIRNSIEKANYDFKNQYEELIINGKLETVVNLQTSFYEEEDNSTLWGLFINAGYLTVSKVIDLLRGKYCIEIPNYEVRREFIKLTEYYLKINSGQLEDIIDSLVKEDKNLFLKEYQKVLMIPSYYDLKSENSYHMMMLGMSICLNKDYQIISNREVGKGRNDLILKSKDEKKTSYVLEFKYLKEDKKDIEKELDQLSNEAIQQIKERKYDVELKGKVIYIGLAHHGKDVSMKWESNVG